MFYYISCFLSFLYIFLCNVGTVPRVLVRVMAKSYGQDLGGFVFAVYALVVTYPLIGPKKGMNRDNKDLFIIFSVKCRVLYNRFLAFYGGPGGFRELREAYRKHFH